MLLIFVRDAGERGLPCLTSMAIIMSYTTWIIYTCCVICVLLWFLKKNKLKRLNLKEKLDHLIRFYFKTKRVSCIYLFIYLLERSEMYYQ